MRRQPLPGAAAPAPTMPYAPYVAYPEPPRSSTGETLIAVGAGLGLGLGLMYVFMFGFFFTAMFASEGAAVPADPSSEGSFDPFLLGTFIFLMMAFVAGPVIGAVLALVGRSKIRTTNGGRGHVLAIVGASLMLPNIIAGGLALAGAIVWQVAAGQEHPSDGQPFEQRRMSDVRRRR